MGSRPLLAHPGHMTNPLSSNWPAWQVPGPGQSLPGPAGPVAPPRPTISKPPRRPSLRSIWSTVAIVFAAVVAVGGLAVIGLYIFLVATVAFSGGMK